MNCKNCTSSFEMTEGDKVFYQKINVPEPTLCPDCRLQRRLAVRNERALYPDECDLCGKKMISVYSPKSPFKVYCSECWHGDQWNAEDYGRDYDFNRPFFEQFAELQKDVPRINLAVMNAENCDYCNYTAQCKDCYLIFGSVNCERCYYGSPYYCNDCVDTFLARECELCYECTDCEKCHSCQYCKDCSNSSSLLFCNDCRGCRDCIGSTMLRNKQYTIFNEPYSKEEYEKKKAEFNTGSYAMIQAIKKKYANHLLKFPVKYAQNLQDENSSGNYIVKCKNNQRCFDVKQLEDCHYCAQVIDGKDSMDTNYCEHVELMYEHVGFEDNYDIQFSNTCGYSKFIRYSDFCYSSEELFGCISLKHKKYCILNKQYSKEEYDRMVARIVARMVENGEWGEFFPATISPFSYNESVAEQYFPMTKEEVLAKEWQWKERDYKEYKPATIQLPDGIKEVNNEITKEVLACESCQKNYRIIPQELQFYRNQNIPIPRNCPDCRYQARIDLRPPRKIWKRNCDQCNVKIQTAYAPERPEKVYCEKCYLEELN